MDGPNGQVQQRAGCKDSAARKNRYARPLCSNGWFGNDIHPESTPNPLSLAGLHENFTNDAASNSLSFHIYGVVNPRQ